MLKYRNPASVQKHAKLKLCFVRGDATPATLVRQLVLRDQELGRLWDSLRLSHGVGGLRESVHWGLCLNQEALLDFCLRVSKPQEGRPGCKTHYEHAV